MSRRRLVARQAACVCRLKGGTHEHPDCPLLGCTGGCDTRGARRVHAIGCPRRPSRGGARKGAGRKPVGHVIGETETVSVTFDASSPSDTDELDALASEWSTTRAGAVRRLIRESAKRRARRRK